VLEGFVVVGNKYIDLSQKSPKEAAEIVGEVEKSNYLAHTIREMELALMRTRRMHYHIFVYAATSPSCTKSKITFFDYCCEIRLAANCEKTDDRTIRLILAHELGHLIYNFDNLKNPEILENPTPSQKEEAFAWIFAYHLINVKSAYHKYTHGGGRFIYSTPELKDALSNLVRKKNPTIHGDVMRGIEE
jgi:hypothetical protein